MAITSATVEFGYLFSVNSLVEGVFDITSLAAEFLVVIWEHFRTDYTEVFVCCEVFAAPGTEVFS